jgi:hypothetical protein
VAQIGERIVPGPCSTPSGGKSKASPQAPFQGKGGGSGRHLRRVTARLEGRIKDYESMIRTGKGSSAYKKPGSMNLRNN